MGSPDPRQIDGIGGAHPLTSKVAVVSPSADPGADVDYLFLQVGVDDGLVSDRQNCGNLLAGVGQFALERGLTTASGPQARVRIRMLNAGSSDTGVTVTGSVATATFPLDGDGPVYAGETAISGVPGTAAEVRLEFEDIAGSGLWRVAADRRDHRRDRRRRGDLCGQRHAHRGGAGYRPRHRRRRGARRVGGKHTLPGTT